MRDEHRSKTMIEVIVAKGHTLVAGKPNDLGEGKAHGAGEKVMVSESEVAHLIRLGVINQPQTEDAPTIAEPPPIEGQVKIARSDDAKA